jgi:hypothetical protein
MLLLKGQNNEKPFFKSLKEFYVSYKKISLADSKSFVLRIFPNNGKIKKEGYHKK